MAIKDEVDILVVLADVRYEQCRSLAQKAEDIDVIVCAHGVALTEEPEQVNGVYLVQAGYEGQTIGNLTLTLGKDNRIRTAEGTVITLDDTIDDNQPDVQALLNAYYTCLEEHKEALLNDEQIDPVEGGLLYGLCRMQELSPAADGSVAFYCPCPCLYRPYRTKARIIIRNAFPVTQRGFPIRVVSSCPISLLRWRASSVRCATVREVTMFKMKVFPYGITSQDYMHNLSHFREKSAV